MAMASISTVSYATLLFLFHYTFVDCMDYEYVTCGSALKLMNKVYQVRLHSHDVKYGSGSGQQSVTGMPDQDDANSYWQVNGKIGSSCQRGEPIKCGQTIRLTHVRTGKNLHSHHFSAPMSSNEHEVSAFGEGGEGDHLDHWSVICSGNQKLWSRNEYVKFKHSETGAHLTCTQQTYGRPIHGQQEIAGSIKDPNKATNYWKSLEGFYIKPTENSTKK